MAVGRRLGGNFGADDAVGAAAVVDHHLLADTLAELLPHEAADDVVAAAGRERHNQTDRFRGKFLRRS